MHENSARSAKRYRHPHSAPAPIYLFISFFIYLLLVPSNVFTMRINNNNIKLYLFSIIAVVLLLIIINIAIPKDTKPKTRNTQHTQHTNLGNDILRDVQTGQTSSAGMQQIQQSIDSYKSKDVFGTILNITKNNVLTLNADIASSSIIGRAASFAICDAPCVGAVSNADLHWDFQSIINLGQPGKYSFTIDQTSGIKYTYDTVSGALRVVIGSIEYHDNGSALNYKTYCHCDFFGLKKWNDGPAYYSVPLNDLKITLTNIALDCTMLVDRTGTLISLTINNINVGGLRVFDDVISGLTAVFGFGYDFAQLLGDNIIKPIVNSNLPKNIQLTPTAAGVFLLIISG